MKANNTPIKPDYSKAEEWLNCTTHGLGFVAAIFGLVYIVIRAQDAAAITASAIYGSTLIMMFLASTVYHAVQHSHAKSWLKLMDHSAIYLLIAGTYTPILLLTVGGALGWISTVAIWVFAIAGVLFKCVARHRFPKVSVMTYLLMGWFAILLIYPLYKAMPGAGLWLIVAGGLCFSFGVFFYMAKSRKYTHAIWHLFVLAGCSFHYFSIYYYVV